jgi:hypothetical protein
MLKKMKWWLLPIMMASMLNPLPTAVAQPTAYQKEIIVGVAIRNKSNVEVTFSLRNIEGDWVKFSLAPGGRRTYKGYDRIWIYTSNANSVLYRLKEEDRYAIYWNEASSQFDVGRQVYGR